MERGDLAAARRDMGNGGDAQALREALAALEDWDDDLFALFGLAGSHEKPQELVASDTARQPSKHARRRQAKQAEVAQLESDAVALQMQLDELRRHRVAGQPSGGLASAWADVAERQRARRLAAQCENDKLREEISSQQRDGRRMLKMTQRATAQTEQLPRPIRVDGPWSSCYRGPKMEVAEQLAHLDRLATTATGVFVPQADITGREWFRTLAYHEPNSATGSVDCEFQVAWLLPFAMERVADAVWLQTTRLPSKSKSVEFLDLHEDQDTLVSQLISLPTENGEIGVSHCQVASRRLPPEDNSAVVVLNAGRAFVFEGSQRVGCADVEGWLRVERLNSPSPCRPLARIKWCRRIRVYPPEPELMTPFERAQWLHLIVTGPMKSSVEKNIDWNAQALENMLLAPR